MCEDFLSNKHNNKYSNAYSLKTMIGGIMRMILIINFLVIIFILIISKKLCLIIKIFYNNLLRKDNFQCMYIKIGSIDFFPNFFLRIQNGATCILYLILSRYVLTAPIVEREAGSREMFIAIRDNYAAERGHDVMQWLFVYRVDDYVLFQYTYI